MSATIHRRISGATANITTYIVLIVGALVTLVPFGLSAITSLKSPQQFASTSPLSLPTPVTFENYSQLLSGNTAFVQAITLTVLVSGTIVLSQIFFSILAAFAFARLRFPGRDVLFWVFLATMMVPGVVTVVPLYLLFVEAGLRDSFLGIVAPSLLGSPYAIFLLRQSFRQVPEDLLHAARLDGASAWRILWTIIVPLNWPIIATLIVITLVSHWNSFMWPLIITSKQRWQVITVATSNLQTQYDGHWTLVTAATMIALLPLIVIFLIFQRRIVSALSIGGLR